MISKLPLFPLELVLLPYEMLPLLIKKDLINMDSEPNRLVFINTIFNDVLTQPLKPENRNMPAA